MARHTILLPRTWCGWKMFKSKTETAEARVLQPTIGISDFQALVMEVMSTVRSIERELTDHDRNHYLMRILPYRTMENKIDGAVITISPTSVRSAVEAS
jgi:hypothetical protein